MPARTLSWPSSGPKRPFRLRPSKRHAQAEGRKKLKTSTTSFGCHNHELAQINGDLVNLLTTVDIPTHPRNGYLKSS
jgi:hypothetical protein